MHRAFVFVLLAVAAEAQIKRAPFASGYMYSYYVPQSASTPWRLSSVMQSGVSASASIRTPASSAPSLLFKSPLGRTASKTS